jgi:hypothetical protein
VLRGEAVVSRLVVGLAVLGLLVGCWHRSWGHEESARIEEVVGDGWEPLTPALVDGIPVPHDPVAEAPRAARSRGRRSGEREAGQPGAREKSARRASRSKRSARAKSEFRPSGFSFSGLD